MIIFVGSKEKGYFCEDVAAKFDQAVEYIDTDIHIVNQIPEIMNYKENCEYLVVDVEQYADDADAIIDSIMKVKEAVNTLSHFLQSLNFYQDCTQEEYAITFSQKCSVTRRKT